MKLLCCFPLLAAVTLCFASCATGENAHYTPSQEAAQHSDHENPNVNPYGPMY